MKTQCNLGRAIRLLGIGICLLGAPTLSRARELTIDDRVAAQRAIEQVYWSHRIWPSVNGAQKPPLSAVLPDGAIRAKVESSLRASMLLDVYWHQPLTASELQGEIDRFVRETKAPGTLRELFAALHDDPFLIAECLARPALAEKRARAAFAADETIHGAQRAALTSALASVEDPSTLTGLNGHRQTVTLFRDDHPWEPAAPGDSSLRLPPPAWTHEIDRLAAELNAPSGLGIAGLPLGRMSHLIDEVDRFTTFVVRAKDSGSVSIESVSWPKRDFGGFAADTVRVPVDPGAIVPPNPGYSLPTPSTGGCVDDTWTSSFINGGPSARSLNSAIWTGAEMIVWGGYSSVRLENTGGRFDPATNSWLPSSLSSGSGPNVPLPRYFHTAVWTGTEMIIWGGWEGLSTGGRFNPALDAWVATSLTTGSGANVAPATASHTAVWTGSEMIVWGGETPLGHATNAGGRYDPATDSWAATSLTTGSGPNVPGARYGHTAVWTGSEMIVWGGVLNGLGTTPTGGRYNPSTDSWAASQLTSGAGAYRPSSRWEHTAVWTGTEMVIWGGSGPFGFLNTGGRYDPTTDSWATSSLTLGTGTNVPQGRWHHAGVWTGDELVVWGGSYYDGTQFAGLNTGGRYNPSTDSWLPTSVSGLNVPVGRDYAVAVWTGPFDRRMLVWGGSPLTTTVGLYCAQPCTPLTWYQDADSDGHGSAASTTSACLRPAGYAPDPDDCDDARAVTYPGAPEVCDGLDNDCTGATPIDLGGDALCDDANPCTDETCGGIAGCHYTNNTGTCDDGDPCTGSDTCGAGLCHGSPVSGGPCDDLNACTKGDVCDNGVCIGPIGQYCEDNNVCTADSCDPATGCVNDSSQLGDLCDDGNACTANACDPVEFCVFPPSAAGSSCEDFDACTGPDLCDGQGTCIPGNALDCDDHNPCTDDSCEPAAGCIHANNANPCSDGNLCTLNDRCTNGSCQANGYNPCYPADQCHEYGTCDPATGACANPAYPDGTYCYDNDLCTSGETCQAGICTPAIDGHQSPDPKTSGYYIQLCQKRDAGQLPWHGDYLTYEDAYCIGALTSTFNYFYLVDQICDVLQHGQHGGRNHGGPGNGPDGNACDQGENELIATAINLCRARLCAEQRIDSQCHGNASTTVAASFGDADAILDSADRTATTCRDATCELREINTGHALEMGSLTLARESGAVRLTWASPVFDDGTGAPSGYEIWRRPLRSPQAFTRIDTTTEPTYLDHPGASGSFEYAVTAVIPSQ